MRARIRSWWFSVGLAASCLPAAAQIQVLHTFQGGDTDGEQPRGALIQASDGMLYGTTARGGLSDDGTIYRLNPAGGAPIILHSFDEPEGEQPVAALVQASDGNFYGTTEFGGMHDKGTVFRITPAGDFTLLHSFDGLDGERPVAELVQGRNGFLYGTTSRGGGSVACADGCGAVFRTTLDGDLTKIFAFNLVNGMLPMGGLVEGSNDFFYGTTREGGQHDWGTVFFMTPEGTVTNIHHFDLPVDGGAPESRLIERDGFMWGTASEGGPGSGSSPSGGASPGTLFRITLGGTYHRFHTFAEFRAMPDAGLIFAADGKLYGITRSGGTVGHGRIFRFHGILRTMASFEHDVTGSGPDAALLQAVDGFLYGTVRNGGPNGGVGVIFKFPLPPIEPPLFCPDYFVPRDQMAVFLLRAKNGPLYFPPDPTGLVFFDVPATAFAAGWIEALAAAQVTAGCGDGNYCPASPVTREQMAVFLLRMFEGPTYVPPPCVAPPFVDVPCASPFASWIQELVARGVTAGCGGGAYCPTTNVSRAQMAVFLLVMKYGTGYVPPLCQGTFGDVFCPSVLANFIEQLFAEGITAGCFGAPP
jgi:uncharacterized repeat protein (TIGR03803 family)